MMNSYTISETLSLDSISDVKISPNGSFIAYTILKMNFKENRYENHCYIYNVITKVTNQLTRNSDVSNLCWIDDNTLSLLKKDFSEKDPVNQIHIYNNLVGDSEKLTNTKKGVDMFEYFQSGFIFVSTNSERKDLKNKEIKYGDFKWIEEDKSKNGLYYFSLESMRSYLEQKTYAYEEEAKELIEPVIEISSLFPDIYHIENLVISTNNKIFGINTTSKDDLFYSEDTNCFLVKGDLNKSLISFVEKKKARKTDHQDTNSVDYLPENIECIKTNIPKGSRINAISPNGEDLLFNYSEDDNILFYKQKDIFHITVQELLACTSLEKVIEQSSNMTQNIDQDIESIIWKNNNIYFQYYDSCSTKIAYIDTSVDKLTNKIEISNFTAYLHFDVAELTNSIVLTGTLTNELINVYLLTHENKNWLITNISNLHKDFDCNYFGTTEIITWKSRDDVQIEGVLRKPKNFDPKKKYPLLLLVHGGPTWLSFNFVFDSSDKYYYPTLQFINNDILVLKPNYRGGIGRGSKFKELNVNNLGEGDLWDIESGIEYLSSLGFIDEKHIGCMGWSQGGYISAYVATHSNKFKAVSMGAGVSDWYTYYMSNDIRQFTLDYIKGDPKFDNPNYIKSSPMRGIKHHTTPTLIQHGEKDNRVPFANATEFYRELKRKGEIVYLFSYPDMSHGITKPKENRAVLEQNFSWFMHFLKERELKFFEK